MKKLLSWLAFGVVATSTAIAFKSNIWILISMSSLLLAPLFFVVLKIVERNQAIERNQPDLKIVSSHNLSLENELARRERMRSEANQLQAELARINQIDDRYERVFRRTKWSLKADVHYKTHADLYEHISDINDVNYPRLDHSEH